MRGAVQGPCQPASTMTLTLSGGQLTAADRHLGTLLLEHMDPRSRGTWNLMTLMCPPLSGGWVWGAPKAESDSLPKVTAVSRSK